MAQVDQEEMADKVEVILVARVVSEEMVTLAAAGFIRLRMMEHRERRMGRSK